MKVGVVVIDTLRHDVFNDVMTKTVDAADFVFDNCYSTSRWTVPAHGSLFTGFYPTEVGTHSEHQHLSTERQTLAEAFSAHGVTTVGLSNNTYVDSFFGFDRGFEEFVRGPALQGRPTDDTGFRWDETMRELSPGLRKYPEALARIVTSDSPTFRTVANGLKLARNSNALERTETVDWMFEALDALADGDFFLFANLMTCHSPYRAPPEYQTVEPPETDPLDLALRSEPVSDAEHRRQWEAYRDCARYLDDRLPKMMDAIDWDLLFILSDHGELFGEHGLRQHQYGVYEELVHVPCVAVGDLVPAGHSEALVSLLDIHRALLDAGDVDGESRGVNPFNGGEREQIYAESVGNYRYSPDARGINANIPESWGEPHYVYGEGSRRYVVDKDGERVVDLTTGKDHADELTAMAEATAEFRDGLDPATVNANKTEPPQEIQERLEYLGYR